jgi:hypothetical protein
MMSRVDEFVGFFPVFISILPRTPGRAATTPSVSGRKAFKRFDSFVKPLSLVLQFGNHFSKVHERRR